MEYKVQNFIEHIEEKDPKLAKTLQKIVAKLAAYYPEHQVFSLSAIDDELRDRLSKIYKDCGCGTVEELLQKCDFSMISGDAVKSLRSSVLYRPGDEPGYYQRESGQYSRPSGRVLSGSPCSRRAGQGT